MPALKNKRHEKFAQLTILGHGPQAAYRQVKSTKVIAKNDKHRGQEILQRPDVQARIAELQSKNEDEVEDLRKTVVDFLRGVVVARPLDVDMDSSLCEIRYVGKEGRPVPFLPSKHGAAERLAKMHGWDKDVLEVKASEQILEIVQSGFKD